MVPVQKRNRDSHFIIPLCRENRGRFGRHTQVTTAEPVFLQPIDRAEDAEICPNTPARVEEETPDATAESDNYEQMEIMEQNPQDEWDWNRPLDNWTTASSLPPKLEEVDEDWGSGTSCSANSWSSVSTSAETEVDEDEGWSSDSFGSLDSYSSASTSETVEDEEPMDWTVSEIDQLCELSPYLKPITEQDEWESYRTWDWDDSPAPSLTPEVEPASLEHGQSFPEWDPTEVVTSCTSTELELKFSVSSPEVEW